MDRLCLIDPVIRGGGVNRISSFANPKGGLFLVWDNPSLRAFSRLLPLCFCFAAAVLFVRLLLSQKNRFVANMKHMAGSGWAQRCLALLGSVPPLLSSSSCCPALHAVKQNGPGTWVLPEMLRALLLKHCPRGACVPTCSVNTLSQNSCASSLLIDFCLFPA